MLSELNPDDVCKRAGASYNKTGSFYILKSFGMEFSINPKKEEIRPIEGHGERLLNGLGYFISHSFLWYLINSKDIPVSGRLVKPENLKGGQHFFRGTHHIPLETLTKNYETKKQAFIERGMELGGRAINMADASIELLPLPNVPVTLLLWIKDDEFPSRSTLLFDSTIEIHLPLDIIWSVAMMSVLAMVS